MNTEWLVITPMRMPASILELVVHNLNQNSKRPEESGGQQDQNIGLKNVHIVFSMVAS
jgi:hypothetical protein